MDMLPVPTNHALYKDHSSINQEMALPMPVQILQQQPNDPNCLLPHMPLNPSNIDANDMKLKAEFDEESNNGPLDFSLHRIQDIVFNNRNNIAPRRSKAPRVKLTLRETSEQRERRLQKGRERMRNLRANETPEERSVRLLKARKCQERRRQKERELESVDEREQRLAKARERTRLRREQETPEQREKRLRTTRERLRLKRMSESFEERQRRLYLQRERKKEKYHKMTPEEKEMLRLSERHSKHYKTDPNQEKRQTRGICIKYDAFEDDLDEALLKFQNEAPHMTNDSEDGVWLAEPEVCLSVGSLDNYTPDKNSTSNRENGDSGTSQSNTFSNTNNSNSNNNNNNTTTNNNNNNNNSNNNNSNNNNNVNSNNTNNNNNSNNNNNNNINNNKSSSSNNNTNSSSSSNGNESSTTIKTTTSSTETSETSKTSESVISTETEATTTTATNVSSVPPPQDLQEQLSQHITNVALNISDTSKPSYEEPQTYTKMTPCYPPPPQPIPSSHASETYSSYQCNNNQPEYIKDNSNSNCVTVSAPNYNVFHGTGGVSAIAAIARDTSRYQYCAQGYTPQQSNNQATTVTDSYSHRSHPIFSQTSQSVSHQQVSHQTVNHPSVTHQALTHQSITHHSNYSDHEAPLNLQQHHTQMLPRYGTMC